MNASHRHVVLLGDSIFDNRSYVEPGERDVVEQVRARLPEGSRATLLAIDGDVLAGVPAQLERLPADATHLVVSIGGNDVLGLAGALERPAQSFAEVLAAMVDLTSEFEASYRAMLAPVLARGLPVALCTIYYPRFGLDEDERLSGHEGLESARSSGLQRPAEGALAFFDDAILRVAFAHGLPVIDLRLVCSEARDYANPIEPSAHGGAKIAERIVRLTGEHDFEARRCAVYP